MKLILMGGIHGVGKTTLLEYIKTVFGERITFFDPGEYFWKHHLAGEYLPADVVEEMALRQLTKLKDKELVVSNWHYAVWKDARYIPQFAFERLQKLIAALNPESVTLVLLDADSKTVFERRLKDRSLRKRKLDLDAIEKEKRATDIYFEEHKRTIEAFAPVSVCILKNENLATTQRDIILLFESLL